MEEAIRVCIRQRPLFQKEIDAGHKEAWDLASDGTVTLQIADPQGLPIKKHYAFDICFNSQCKNQEVYEKTASDIVKDIVKGINGCYLAYGQTGCGKTHSIMGTAEDPGILPRSVAEIFDLVNEDPSPTLFDATMIYQEFLIRVTYVEIYLERVNDLFQDGPKGENQPLENLDVKEDPKGGFYVVGLAEQQVSSAGAVMQLLHRAEIKRHFARTNFNETSSRSHTVFSTIVEATLNYPDGSTIVQQGELKLVDLAGNEKSTASHGLENAKERQAEGQAINKSLFLLSEVISKLSKRAELLKKGTLDKADKLKKDLMHIPWRDSKLTRLLQKSLVGNSRACLLVAVHPSTQALEISLSTLRFALKAKQIKKKIVRNFISPEQSLIMQQKDTIKRLQDQLAVLQGLSTGELTDEIRRQLVENLPSSTLVVPKTTLEEKNEAVMELKKQLQSKVEALSKIVSKARIDFPENENVDATRVARSTTVVGIDRGFQRLRTLPRNLTEQLYRRDFKREIAGTPFGSIAQTLKYLKAIQDLNRDSENSTAEIPDSKKLSSKFQTIDFSNIDAITQASHPESSSNLIQYATCTMNKFMSCYDRIISSLRISNENLSHRNETFISQIQYLKELLSKLGLSVLIAGTEASGDPQYPAQLGASLTQFHVQKSSSSKFYHESRLSDFLNKVQPLALAMASAIVSGGLARALGVDQDVSPDKRLVSIMNELHPWEQCILAILFEFKRMYDDIQKATSTFRDIVRDLKKKLAVLMTEKLELTEHSARLMEEICSFKYTMSNKADQAATETFAKMLARINALQTELGEQNIKLKRLQVEYDQLKESKLKIEEENVHLKEEFFKIDMDLIPAELKDFTGDTENMSIIKTIALDKKVIAQLRLQLDEASRLQGDLRKVNNELWRDLKISHTSYEATFKDQRLAQFELKNERASMQKRVESLYKEHSITLDENERLKSRIQDLELKLATAIIKNEENIPVKMPSSIPQKNEMSIRKDKPPFPQNARKVLRTLNVAKPTTSTLLSPIQSKIANIGKQLVAKKPLFKNNAFLLSAKIGKFSRYPQSLGSSLSLLTKKFTVKPLKSSSQIRSDLLKSSLLGPKKQLTPALSKIAMHN